MFKREVNLPKSQSFFIFGARGTGKSSLLKSHFSDKEVLFVDLLNDRELSPLALDPDLLIDRVRALPESVEWVIIDEIQKLPKLLDAVHHLIESTKKHFALSGSSARKLRSGGANLLAGRAVERRLFPLTKAELGTKPNVDELLRFGSLPKVFSLLEHEEKEDFLFSYGNTYLREEVWAEQLVRKLDPFRKFLVAAARADGKVINYTKFSRQVGVDVKTVQSYFQILEDTLLGVLLDCFDPSIRARIRKHPKFYFFDTGVCRALADLLPVIPHPGTSYYGDVFESWLINEWIRHCDYNRKRYSFSYFDLHDGRTVDLVIERPGKPLAIVEIKSTKSVAKTDTKGLDAVSSLFPDSEFFLVSQDEKRLKTESGVCCLHWKDALQEL